MAREPFRSGVLDHEALYKRIRELGIKPVVGDKNGVDVTPKDIEPTPEPGKYYYPG
jgi:hypothetical protein